MHRVVHAVDRLLEAMQAGDETAQRDAFVELESARAMLHAPEPDIYEVWQYAFDHHTRRKDKPGRSDESYLEDCRQIAQRHGVEVHVRWSASKQCKYYSVNRGTVHLINQFKARSLWKWLRKYAKGK